MRSEFGHLPTRAAKLGVLAAVAAVIGLATSLAGILPAGGSQPAPQPPRAAQPVAKVRSASSGDFYVLRQRSGKRAVLSAEDLLYKGDIVSVSRGARAKLRLAAPNGSNSAKLFGIYKHDEAGKPPAGEIVSEFSLLAGSAKLNRKLGIVRTAKRLDLELTGKRRSK